MASAVALPPLGDLGVLVGASGGAGGSVSFIALCNTWENAHNAYFITIVYYITKSLLLKDKLARMNNEEIRALTSVRFIAAFYVFLLHISLFQPIFTTPWIYNFVSHGTTGISLFFMLSGFILAYRYDGIDLKAAGYYRNRFARIYPIYFLSGLVTLPWMMSSMWPQHHQPPSVFFVIVANIFLLQAWFNILFNMWNEGSWSISAEMFFLCDLS